MPSTMLGRTTSGQLIVCWPTGWVFRASWSERTQSTGRTPLTIHSSRSRFAARLNSGVRPHQNKIRCCDCASASSSTFRATRLRLHRASQVPGKARFCGVGSVRRSLRQACAGVSRGVVAAPRSDSSLCWSIAAQAPVGVVLRAQAVAVRVVVGLRLVLAPNQSFKPNPLRRFYVVHGGGGCFGSRSARCGSA